MRPGFSRADPTWYQTLTATCGHAVIFVQDHGQAVRQREHRVGHRRARRRRRLRVPRSRMRARWHRGMASDGDRQESPGHACAPSNRQSKLNPDVFVPPAGRADAERARRGARAPARSPATPLLDLTETNPTAVGLPYPDGCSRSLADPGVASLRPRSARAARRTRGGRGACTATRVGVDAGPDRADGEHERGLLVSVQAAVRSGRRRARAAAQLSAVRAADAARRRSTPCRIASTCHGGWAIDRDEPRARADRRRTRAILVVSPNNPTGSMLRARRPRVAGRRWRATAGWRIIADEVFADYPLSPRPDATSLAGEDARADVHARRPVEVGRPAADEAGLDRGERSDRRSWPSALERLEMIADTYLSVSTPVQLAAAAAARRAGARSARAIAARLAAESRRACGRRRGRIPSLTLLEPEGGWSAVLRVPAIAVRGGARAAAARRRARARASGILLRFRRGSVSRAESAARARRSFDEGVVAPAARRSRRTAS